MPPDAPVVPGIAVPEYLCLAGSSRVERAAARWLGACRVMAPERFQTVDLVSSSGGTALKGVWRERKATD